MDFGEKTWREQWLTLFAKYYAGNTDGNVRGDNFELREFPFSSADGTLQLGVYTLHSTLYTLQESLRLSR